MVGNKHYVLPGPHDRGELRLLNQLKGDLNLSWDELVLDAVCARQSLDRAAMAP